MRDAFQTDEHIAVLPPSLPPAAPLAASDEPRIRGPFPARVKGRDASGVPFKLSTQLEDISAGHCHVSLDRDAPSGTTLFITTQINRAVVVLRGTVLEVSPRADGVNRTSVKIVRHRFVTRRVAPEIS